MATPNPQPGIKSKLRVAVLGTGALGKEHARIYAELAKGGLVELAGVYDVVPDTARRVAEKLRAPAFASVPEAAAAAEALSIVTPTSTHFDLARPLLLEGKHLLIEKPMTDNTAQAAELVQLAGQHRCVLQVGHVERFNPVFKYLETVATEPRFIETHRLSPYPARSTDIGVVLDLMIHDLDIVLAFVKSPVVSVDAVGIPVLSPSEDIANARLRFESGCVANLTVSRDRIARDGEEESSLLKKLLASKDTTIVSEFAGKRIVREPVPITKEDPLKLELQHFVECVRQRQTPRVSGESAKQALDLAFEITRQIQLAPSTAEAQRAQR